MAKSSKRKRQLAMERKNRKRAANKYTNAQEFFNGFVETLPKIEKVMKKVYEDFPCLQIQCAIMDVQSIQDHLVDLANNGPKKPMQDVPLEDSEVGVVPETDMPSMVQE